MTGVTGRILIAELSVPDAEQRAMVHSGGPVSKIREDDLEKKRWAFREDGL